MNAIRVSDTNQDKQISVAIAEDFEILRELLTNSINSFQECNVILSAKNGKELLTGIEQLKILPDVCLLDISMPVMNGYETQLALKQRWPQIKSIALSIYDDKYCISQMMHNGAVGFISKQSSPEIIHEALMEVYNNGYYHKYVPEYIRTQTEPLPNLTEREKEYLTLICAEYTNGEIAEKLTINVRTVEHYRDNVYRKLNVNNKADLLFYVRKTGIVFMK